MTNTQRARRAMKYVLNFERKQGRSVEDVSRNRKHVGYDIKSGEKMIEVKGVGSSWDNFTWQPLYKTTIECLKKNRNKFYLYIIKFKSMRSDKVEGFYIIPGVALRRPKFNIEIETYRLSPINQNRLKEFLQSWQ